MAILDAILAGERDPAKLAKLRDRRIKASEATIVKWLVGDYRREHPFTFAAGLNRQENLALSSKDKSSLFYCVGGRVIFNHRIEIRTRNPDSDL